MYLYSSFISLYKLKLPIYERDVNEQLQRLQCMSLFKF